MNKGTILQFRGSWGSGIGYLDIQDSETGEVQSIPCENAPTVRALEAAFGDVITEGHTANGEGYKGKEIYWDYEEMSLLLGSFTPVDEVEYFDPAYDPADDELLFDEPLV